MSDLDHILGALHPLAGKLVHFELHFDNEVELPASVVAVGILSTAETNLEGVREGTRVLVTLKEGELSGPAAAGMQRTPVGTSVVLSCAQIHSIASIHGPNCGCVAFHTVRASYAFMDSAAHTRRRPEPSGA